MTCEIHQHCAQIIASCMWHGMEAINLWNSWGEAHVALIVAFSSFVFCGVWLNSNTMVGKPVTCSFSTVGRCQVLLEKEISIPLLYGDADFLFLDCQQLFHGLWYYCAMIVKLTHLTWNSENLLGIVKTKMGDKRPNNTDELKLFEMHISCTCSLQVYVNFWRGLYIVPI